MKDFIKSLTPEQQRRFFRVFVITLLALYIYIAGEKVSPWVVAGAAIIYLPSAIALGGAHNNYKISPNRGAFILGVALLGFVVLSFLFYLLRVWVSHGQCCHVFG